MTWKVLVTKDGRCGGVVEEASIEFDGEDHWYNDYIVQTDGGFYGPNLEDAYLIASSPDLLAALKAMIHFYKSPNHDVKCERQGEDDNCAICKAEKALARAENKV